MKKEIEKKIIKKIYRLEARRTFADILFSTMSFFVLIGFFILIISVLSEIIIEQKTFEPFQLLQEEPDIIWKYLASLVEYLYYEIPHAILVLLMASFVICLYVTFLITKNFIRTKNKLRAITAFLFRMK